MSDQQPMEERRVPIFPPSADVVQTVILPSGLPEKVEETVVRHFWADINTIPSTTYLNERDREILYWGYLTTRINIAQNQKLTPEDIINMNNVEDHLYMACSRSMGGLVNRIFPVQPPSQQKRKKILGIL